MLHWSTIGPLGAVGAGRRSNTQHRRRRQYSQTGKPATHPRRIHRRIRSRARLVIPLGVGQRMRQRLRNETETQGKRDRNDPNRMRVTGIVPKPLFDNLTLCTAKCRDFGALALEKPEKRP
jgi:hypothetical protein